MRRARDVSGESLDGHTIDDHIGQAFEEAVRQGKHESLRPRRGLRTSRKR